MSELEPRPAQERDGPDMRRLAVTRKRFADFIDPGIVRAMNAHTDIDAGTAKCMAHALGRAHGRTSALAELARTNEGTFADVREELLSIYHHPDVTADARLLVDWLGVYLIEKDGRGSGRRFMNEYLPPKLEQILVSDTVTVRNQHFTVHVPGTCGAAGLAELADTLTDLDLDKDEALQAFLSLHDVNALSGDIMTSFENSFVGSFHSREEAIRDLSPIEDWETSLGEWVTHNNVMDDDFEWSWNYGSIFDRISDVYEIVEWQRALHVFTK